MPTFEDPAANAAEGLAAARGLAHATRIIDDPLQIYEVPRSLSQVAASILQSLSRLAAFHDGPAGNRAWVAGDPNVGRAASYHVSWELHRAGEILLTVAVAPDRGLEIEGGITFDRDDVQELSYAPRPTLESERSL